MSLSQTDRIARNQARILYSEYLTKLTEYNNGTRTTPPTFKGDTSLFLQAKLGQIETTPAEQTAYVIKATPAPAPPSSLTIVPTATTTTITLSFPVTGTASSYSFVLNGAPTKPAVDNSLGGTVTFTGLLPGTIYNLVVTTSGPSGSSTSAPISIYTLPIAPPVSTFQQIASPGGVTVGWAGGSGASTYTYTVKDASGNILTGYSVEDKSGLGYAVFTGLPAGQQFTVTINSVNPSGTSSSLPFSITTAPSVPTTPPVPSTTSQTGFSIPEPSIPGARGYTYTINGNPVTPTVVGGVVTFSGLTPGQAQNLIVTALGPNNTETPSAPFVMYTAPVPLVPSTFTTIALNSNDVTIRWPQTINSGVTSYTYVVRDMSGNPIPGATVIDNGLTNSSATITGLPAGTQFTVSVISNNSSGSSSSTPFTVYTPPAPSAPTESSFSIPTPSVGGAVSYIYRINGNVVAAAPAVPGFSISGGKVTFTGLPSGVAQTLVVTSVDAGNVQTSTPPLTVYTSPVTIPAASFSTDTSSQTGISLNWPAGSGATSYTYSITDASGNPITNAVVIDDGVTFNCATFTGLLPGTQYIVTVTGINASGATIPTTFTASTAPPTPPQPTPSSISQTGFSIPVPSVTGALSYIYSINGVQVYPNVVNGVATFSGLTPGLEQNLVITAVGPNNVLSSSPPYTVYTSPVSLPTTNFDTSTSTSTGINITWSGYTGATSYTYEVLDASGNPIPGVVITDNGVDSNSAVLTGLAPGTAYTVRVIPNNPSGTAAPITLTAYTAPPPPAQPSPSAPTTTGFTIPAPSVPGALSYIYTINGVQYTPTVSGGNLVFTGLTPGVAQSLVITAVGQNNTRAPSPPLIVYTTPVTLPSSAYTTSTSTTTELRVQWTGVTGATSYTYVVRDASGNVLPGAVVTDNGVASNSAVVSGLTPGTAYTVTVTAINPSGTSTPTVINASTAPPAPSPPVASAPTLTGFSIPPPFVPGGSTYIYTINGVQYTPTLSGGSLVFTGLPSGVPQNLVITAVGPNNVQTPSAPVTIYTIPVPVSSVTTEATPTGVTVSWPPNTTGATSYTYEVLDASGNVMPDITVVDNGVAFNSATVVGLSPGTVYSLRIRATNPSGTTTPTTIPIITGPRVPALPTATAPTVNGFTINTPSSPGALSYIYKINDVVIAPAPAVPGYSVSGGSVVFTGLPQGVPQRLVVTAVGPNNTQTPCAPITVYTRPVTLAPSAYTTTTTTSTGVTVQWTGVTGATSYTYVVRDASGNVVPGAVVTDNGLASNSVSVSGLAPGALYTVTVTAINPSGSSTPTTFNTYTSTATPPQPTPSAPSTTGFTIPAPSVPGAVSYIYLVNGVPVIPTVSGGNRVFTGLTPGVAQTLVIVAVGPNNIQTPSTPLTVYTTPVPINGGSVTTQPSSSGGTISWPAGSGATSYSFTVVDASGNPIPGASVTENGGSNSAIVTGVPPGTVYSVRITAINPSGQTTPTTITATTAPATPSPPIASAPTQNGFSIPVPSVAGALSYIYTINGIPVIPTIANGIATFSGLAAGVIQTLIITAVGPNNTRTSSTPVQVLTTPVSLPSSSFSTPSASPNGVTVRWSGTTGATSYTYAVTDASGNPVTGFTVVDNGVTSNFAAITGLAPGKQYTISVTARNAAGASTPTTFTSYTAPAAPAQPVPSTPTTTGFTIPAPSAAGALSYTYKVNGVTVTPTVSGGNLVFTGLTPGVTQSLVITAVGINNVQTPSTAVIIYTTPVSLPLGAFATTATSPTGFTVQWTGATGATAYSYTITDGSGVAVPTATMTDNGMASNSVSFGGLSVGIGYRVTLTSINPAGSVASATYIGYTGPSPPISFSTSAGSQTGFTVSWQGGIGATSYTYQLNGVSVTPAQNNGMSGKNAVFTGLTAGTTYIVIVTARDNYGSTSSGTYVTVTAPSMPTSITETAATLTSFTVTWTGGDGATSYKYYIFGQEKTPSIDNGVSGKTASFGGLDTTVEYFYLTIKAINAVGETVSFGTQGFVLTPPATNLISSNITSKGFTISSTVDNVVRRVMYSLNGVINSSFTFLGYGNAIFTDLSPGTLYTVIVITDNNAPGDTPSEPLNVTTTVAPSQPLIDASSVPSADITSAGLKIILPSITGGTAPIGFTYSAVDASGNARSVTSSVLNGIATLTGLLHSTAYTVSVTAVDSVGTPSIPSTPYGFTTLVGAQQPISLSNTAPTLSSFSVSWTLGTVGTVPVQYTYTLNNVLTSGSSSTSSPTTFSGLSQNTTYSVIVNAIDQYGSVTASAALSVTTPSVPGAPSGLYSSSVAGTSFTVNWTPGAFTNSYTYTLNGNSTSPSSTTSTSASFTGLTGATSYTVVVTAVNTYGTTSSSGLAVATLATTGVTTLVGNGVAGGYTGGVGTSAALSPIGIAFDSARNFLYFTGQYNAIHYIGQIDLSTNTVSTLSGTSYSAGNTDGTASQAKYNGCVGTCLYNGFLYVCDNSSGRVRKVNIYDGSVTTFSTTVGGPGCQGIAIDSSQTNFYVSNYGTASVYKVPISTGVGTLFKAAGTGNMAGIAVDSSDNIYFCVPSSGTNTGTVRKVTQAGTMTTIDSNFTNPTGITIGADGNLYYSIQNNFYIKKYILPSGPSSIVAGQNGSSGLLNTSDPLTSRFINAYGLAFDTNAYANTGSLVMFVTDAGIYVRKVVFS